MNEIFMNEKWNDIEIYHGRIEIIIYENSKKVKDIENEIWFGNLEKNIHELGEMIIL
jgi:hypothetical protein